MPSRLKNRNKKARYNIGVAQPVQRQKSGKELRKKQFLPKSVYKVNKYLRQAKMISHSTKNYENPVIKWINTIAETLGYGLVKQQYAMPNYPQSLPRDYVAPNYVSNYKALVATGRMARRAIPKRRSTQRRTGQTNWIQYVKQNRLANESWRDALVRLSR